MKLRVLAGTLLAAVLAAAPAAAAPPMLHEVGQDRYHPWAMFSAPGADSVTITFATSPERATDGSFFEENVTGSESLTDEEIAAGRWLSEQTVGSGMRCVMLSASSYSCPEGADCADGYSNLIRIHVPAQTLSKATAKDAVGEVMEDGLLGRSWELVRYDKVEPLHGCARLSRLGIRCKLDWWAGDAGFSGEATVIRRAGSEDLVRWTVRVTDYYCKNTGGKRCSKQYRGSGNPD
jgi:hypothetical protein